MLDWPAWLLFKVLIPLLRYPIAWLWNRRSTCFSRLTGDGSLFMFASTLGWASLGESIPLMSSKVDPATSQLFLGFGITFGITSLVGTIYVLGVSSVEADGRTGGERAEDEMLVVIWSTTSAVVAALFGFVLFLARLPR